MVDYGSGERTNRFVCPNDRQLALRAKLNTGWSIKTATIGYTTNIPKNPALAAEEQEAIVQVIQRAQKLESSEQERIGRLIEKLENMNRNALGKKPSQCLLCGDGFGMLGTQKVVCMDCTRLACQKCTIDASANKIASDSKGHWLCMICAETRETWKKSGAWFFKSIPKYTIPLEPRFNRNRNGRMSRKCRDEDSSSDEESKVWSQMPRRNSSTESTHDTQDLHLPNYSSSETQLSKDLDSLKSHVGSSFFYEIRSWDDSGTPIVVESDGSEASKKDYIASRSMSDWNWSDNRSIEKMSPGSCSINGGIFKSAIDTLKLVDTSMGIIEISLTYDQDTTTLHCTVFRAKNLIAMDIAGLSDPFCKLNILPSAKISTRLRTKTVHKTRNPEFNENLTFYDITETDLVNKALHVLVVDDDKYGHDYMGETRISLDRLRTENTVNLILPLENSRSHQKGPLPGNEMKEWFDDLWCRGQILLSLCYSTKKRALLVTVVRCIDLLPMDNNGLSDPFVKLQLKPNPYHKKHKTSIKWKNLNPEFNEEFAFETRPTKLSTQSLYITVFDKDYGKSNDYLGGLILGGSSSKGQRLKHWLDMIRYPDHRHEQWHNLTEDVLE